MRLPPTQAGGQVLGNTFIDGAHMVLAPRQGTTASSVPEF